MKKIFLCLLILGACSAPNFKSQNVIGDDPAKSSLPGGGEKQGPNAGADSQSASAQEPSLSQSKIDSQSKECAQGGTKIITCAEDTTCSPNSVGYKELTVCNSANAEGLATAVAANCPAAGPSVATCVDTAEPKSKCTSADAEFKITELAPCAALKTMNLPAGGTSQSGPATALPSGSVVNLGCTADDDEFISGGSVGLLQSGMEEFRASFQCKSPSVVSGVLAAGGFECCRASAQPTLVRANDRSIEFPAPNTMNLTLAQEAICPSTHPFLFGVEMRSLTVPKNPLIASSGNVVPLRGDGAVTIAGSQSGFTQPNFKCAALLIGNQALMPSGPRTDIMFAKGGLVMQSSPQHKCPTGQVAIGFKIGAAVYETGYFHNQYVVCSAVSVQ